LVLRPGSTVQVAGPLYAVGLTGEQENPRPKKINRLWITYMLSVMAC
jgi:hypothetical protein